ncbi:hypothetical protein [Streptomyces wuyuanensis]|uniref:hypothetical protein n=1 Tax=Streptomyces wuyuanensis TaxID=1196353 RepID=UPI00344A32D4
MPSPLNSMRTPFSYSGFYASPGWRSEALAYERRLGALCANDAKVLHAAKSTLQSLFDVLSNYCDRKFPNLSDIDRKNKVAEAFFVDDKTSAGQIAPGVDRYSTLHNIFLDGSSMANLREIMTAIYNAAYYQSYVLDEMKMRKKDEEISLRRVIEPWVSPTEAEKSGEPKLADLGLSTSHLNPYLQYLRSSRTLAAARTAAGLVGLADKFSSSVYSLGSMGLYSGYSDASEIAQSQKARITATDPSQLAGRMTSQSYARLGVPLSAFERTFLTSKDTHIEAEAFTFEEVPRNELVIGQDKKVDWQKSLEAAKGKEGVLSVEFGYKNAQIDRVLRFVARKIYHRLTDLSQAGSYADILFQGPEFPLEWIEGSARYSIDPTSAWSRELESRGFPLAAGVSGTTSRMLATFGWLSPNVPPMDFLLALIGWMLPGVDHTLYEVLRGAQIAMLTSAHELQAVGNAEYKKRLFRGSQIGITAVVSSVTSGTSMDTYRALQLWSGLASKRINFSKVIGKSYSLLNKRVAECAEAITWLADMTPIMAATRKATVTLKAELSAMGNELVATYGETGRVKGTELENGYKDLIRDLASINTHPDGLADYKSPEADYRGRLQNVISEYRDSLRNLQDYLRFPDPTSILWNFYSDRLNPEHPDCFLERPDGLLEGRMKLLDAIYSRNLDTTSKNNYSRDFKDWFDRNGQDPDTFLEAISAADLAAIFLYTSVSHQIMNLLLHSQVKYRVALSKIFADQTIDSRFIYYFLQNIVQQVVAKDETEEPYLLNHSQPFKDSWNKLKRQSDQARREELGKIILQRIWTFSPRIAQELRIHVDMTCDALNRLPGYSGRVHRGDWKVSASSIAGYIIDKFSVYGTQQTEIVVPTLASTSTDVDVAKKFAKDLGEIGGRQRVLLSCTLKGAGRDIQIFSSLPSEDEVLVAPGTVFKVTGRKESEFEYLNQKYPALLIEAQESSWLERDIDLTKFRT